MFGGMYAVCLLHLASQTMNFLAFDHGQWQGQPYGCANNFLPGPQASPQDASGRASEPWAVQQEMMMAQNMWESQWHDRGEFHQFQAWQQQPAALPPPAVTASAQSSTYAPPETRSEALSLEQSLLERLTDPPKTKSEASLQDSDFERDVTSSVAMFLQGGDIDESDLEEEDERPAAKDEEEEEEELPTQLAQSPNHQKLLEIFSQFADRLKGLTQSVQDKSVKPTSPGKASSDKSLCRDLRDVAKQMELIAASEDFLSHSKELSTSSHEERRASEPQPPLPAAPVPPVPPAPPAPGLTVKPPPEWQERKWSTASSLAPELARGQCMGAMLRHKPLPSGVDIMQMTVLDTHVKQLIPRLARGGKRASLSAISEALQQLGTRTPLIKALLNLVHLYSKSYCFWVPLQGEVGIALLDAPLPPLDDQLQDRLLSVLAKRLKSRLHTPVPVPDCTGPTGPATAQPSDQSAKTLAQELAKEGITTLMIKNLPTSLLQPQVLEELHRSGFAGRYDFFYMPGTFTNHKSLGYAFVNLVDVASMKEFTLQWHNSVRLGLSSDLPLKVCRAVVQGRDANAQNFGPRMKRIRNPCLRPVIILPDPEVQESAA
ncbi:unnamed protein product [Effrenium voratum]|nr:unnamed protein product [Effrenium voratum]